MSGDAKRYGVKGIFNTLQGEGSRAGARSIFLRLTSCNAWDGDPTHRDRGKGACSLWCDTDFRKEGSEMLTAVEILERLEKLWSRDLRPTGQSGERWVVLTGGEPALQLDMDLHNGLYDNGWCMAVETNGSVDNEALAHVAHLTVSPKRGLSLRRVHESKARLMRQVCELKVVLPGAVDGEGWTDAELEAMEQLVDWDHLYVQPQDPIDSRYVEVSHLHMGVSEFYSDNSVHKRSLVYKANVDRCVKFVESHPRWRLGLQTHKYIGVP
jgi:7-carboxy-7-deazaguanine synthase